MKSVVERPPPALRAGLPLYQGDMWSRGSLTTQTSIFASMLIFAFRSFEIGQPPLAFSAAV